MTAATARSLPVIFRAQKEHGQLWITAVFPTEPGTLDPWTFTIYQHVGQHGSGTRDWYDRTRRATPAEYAPLLRELQGIYGASIGAGDPIVTLRVIQRMTHQHDQQRRARIQQMTEKGGK